MNYSGLNDEIVLDQDAFVDKGDFGIDTLERVQRVVGAEGYLNTIDASSSTSESLVVDLKQGTLLVNNSPTFVDGYLELEIENFVDVIGTRNDDEIAGNDEDNYLEGGAGDDTFYGSEGDDTIDGGSGFDTVDYYEFDAPITLDQDAWVDKDGLGLDLLDGVDRVVGAEGHANTIDGSLATGDEAFVIDLGDNSLVVNNNPTFANDTLELEVVNFVNVFGTFNDDEITGSNAGNVLDGDDGDDVLNGSGGNDVVLGGSGIDVLNGTDSATAGRGEIDFLLGGGDDSDGFILGDRLGTFYGKGGRTDFAIIGDLDENDLIQLSAEDVYRVRRDAQGFNLYAVRNGKSDLIADVHTTASLLLPSGTFTVESGAVNGIFFGA